MAPRQQSAVLVLQGLATAVVALILGVPAGMLAASVAWRLFSGSIGFDWPTEFSVGGIVVLVGSTLACAAGIGLGAAAVSRRPAMLR